MLRTNRCLSLILRLFCLPGLTGEDFLTLALTEIFIRYIDNQDNKEIRQLDNWTTRQLDNRATRRLSKYIFGQLIN